ncbi:MAG: hypothetical protein HC888_04620 [Candidatus Competibacteraceae bacterium]|nr:hypothetical protein [Candidatus Competibacteraceae bacterium]
MRGDKKIVNQNVGEAIKSFADEVLPKVAPKDVRRLKAILGMARKSKIGNKPLYVDMVNRILKAIGYRIALPDGTKCLLCYKPDKKHGCGSIQFQCSGGSRGGFTDTDIEIELVPVPNNYCTNKAAAVDVP